MTETGRIYALFDPRRPDIEEYVGWTVQTLGARLVGHCNDANRKRNHCANWINKLRREGVAVGIRLIAAVPNLPNEAYLRRAVSRAHESHWIAHFRALGRARKNIGNGGEGHDSASAKAYFASIDPAVRSARAKQANRTMGPEGCRARMLKAHITRGPEGQLAARAKASATLGPEGRQAMTRKAREAYITAGPKLMAAKANETLGPAGRSERSRLANAAITPEGRAARSRKMWETRRAKAAAATQPEGDLFRGD